MARNAGRSTARRTGFVFFRSVRTKLVAGSVLLLLFVCVVIFIYYPNQQARATIAEVHARGESLGRTVALGVAIGLETGDLTVIAETIALAQQDPLLLYLAAFDELDTLLASYNPGEMDLDLE